MKYDLNWHVMRHELPQSSGPPEGMSGSYIVFTYKHALMVAEFHPPMTWKVPVPKSLDRVDISLEVFLWAEIPLPHKKE